MSIAIREDDSGKPVRGIQANLHAKTYELLAGARAVAAANLGYAGDLTPQQAWYLFSGGVAELVDVRTRRELDRVGEVPGAKHVEWLLDQSMEINPRFLDELKRQKIGKEDVLLLLCRSGKRSVAAARAATEAGFTNVFNVVEGFEGDGSPQRGWLRYALPVAKGKV